MNQHLRRIADEFEALPVGDEADRKRLLNDLESVVRLLSPNEVERYMQQARQVRFHPLFRSSSGPDFTATTWAQGKAEIIALIKSVQHDYELRQESLRETSASSGRREAADTSRVFVVHGHDKLMLAQIEAFINRIGLEAIVLSAEPNKGRTLIEKFEEHSDVAYAVVIMSADDVGRAASAPPEADKLRARQNVILELGYFIGRYGRDRVAAIADADKGNVEYPSDIQGIAYIPYSSAHVEWRTSLARELRAAGLPIREGKL